MQLLEGLFVVCDVWIGWLDCHLPARRAENHQHLSIVYHAIEILKDVNLSRLLAANKLLDCANDFEENISLSDVSIVDSRTTHHN